MLLGLLLGYELGKSSEEERLAIEKIKAEEEHLSALREQYMLGLLMPVRGQDTFKLAVHQPSLFEFSMVEELLKRIESPVKYFKYYTVGDTYVLEGYSVGTGEYESYRDTELKQNTFIAISTVILWVLAYFLNERVLHLQDKNLFLFILYVMFSISFPLAVSVLSAFALFPQKDESIKDYGKL